MMSSTDDPTRSDIARAIAAGWTVDGVDPADPALCAGSGQLVAWETRAEPCGVCGRRVNTDPSAGYRRLVDHYPELDAPSMSFGL